MSPHLLSSDLANLSVPPFGFVFGIVLGQVCLKYHFFLYDPFFSFFSFNFNFQFQCLRQKAQKTSAKMNLIPLFASVEMFIKERQHCTYIKHIVLQRTKLQICITTVGAQVA